MPIEGIRQGIYNVEYFAGSTGAIYIGDVWVDEVTSFSYSVHQTRRPIYGYASQLFDDVSKGNVLVQGTFSINFKEAGYLWLVLNRYKEVMTGKPDAIYKNAGNSGARGEFDSPFVSSNKNEVNRQNIEQIVNGEVSTFVRNRQLQALTDAWGNLQAAGAEDILQAERSRQSASLGGYASDARRSAARGDTNVGSAEGVFEEFEDAVWGKRSVAKGTAALGQELDQQHRRADDPYLNPFEIYLVHGDFLGSDYDNHTIQRLRDVYILGSSRQEVIDGQPIQEVYSFIARNLV